MIEVTGPRIAMLAPISWRVPPRHYGPWELVVSRLTEGLVARGIDVTLFATADSVTSARLDAVCPRPLSEDPSLDPKVWEGLHIGHAFEQARGSDILHNHYDFLPLTYSGHTRELASASASPCDELELPQIPRREFETIAVVHELQARLGSRTTRATTSRSRTRSPRTGRSPSVRPHRSSGPGRRRPWPPAPRAC